MRLQPAPSSGHCPDIDGCLSSGFAHVGAVAHEAQGGGGAGVWADGGQGEGGGELGGGHDLHL